MFTDLKALSIKEGEVTKITSGGVVLWEKISFLPHTNLVPTAKNKDGTTLDGVGYRRQCIWNGANISSGFALFTAIGLIPFGNGTVQHDIYVYGLDFTGSSSNRYYVYGSTYNMMDGITSGIKDGYASTGLVLSITKLGDHYYKFRTKAYSVNVKYFTISGVTVDGVTPIVTLDEPILG